MTSNPNWYRLSIVDQDTIFPFVNGNGILFRLKFTVQAASVFSVIHISTKTTTIQNPSSVPYNPVHGYFDNRATPFNFPMTTSPTTLTIVRPVSGTQTGTTTVAVGTVTGTPGTITFSALSLPINVSPNFSVLSCTAACSSVLTLTVNGGPKGGVSTAPSGTYFVPIVGNTTSSGVRMAWLKLIIQPPAQPNFVFNITPTAFSQEAGNWTKVNVSVTLTSGAPDSIALGNNCIYRLQGGACTFTPNQGSFPLTSVMNVSTNAVSATTGVYTFNATATTQGTYSEVVVTKTITLTLTVTRTDDLAVQGLGLANRNFAYSGVSLSCPTSCPAPPSPGTQLKSDPKVKYADVNSNNHWDAGEPVVYDNNIDNLFGFGEPVIAGSTITVTQALKADPLIKYFDGNGNNVWDVGEYVVYDTNNNNLYEATEAAIGGPGQLKVSVTIANLGTRPETFVANSTARVVLSGSDCRLNFVDANANHIYNAGNVIVIDSDCNGRYGSGTLDSRMRFVDNIAVNNHWDPGEAVIIDADSSGTYDTSAPFVDKPIANSPIFNRALLLDSTVKFFDSNVNGQWNPGEPVVYDANGNGVYDSGETVISGSPIVGTSLTFDSQIKFVDSNGNGLWNTGEPVGYDTNNNGIYDPDFALSGTAPSNGTALKFDGKLTYLDVVLDNVWDPGETVFYDTSGNGVYDTGETLIVGTAPPPETVLVGTPPAIGTFLSDQHLSYADTNFNAVWDAGEFTVYDTNNSNFYDGGETAIAGLIPATTGATLKVDQKVKYSDTNSNNVWDAGEPVIYDSNNNNIYDAGDSMIHGPTPTIGSTLKSDAKIKYVDGNANGVLDVSESMVWDNGTQITQNNGIYDSGELVPVGGLLLGGILLGSQSITVPIGATLLVTFSVDPGSILSRGMYIIGGYATPITSGCPASPCEFNTGNNGALIIGFTQKLKADVSGDCNTDIVDLSTIGGIFGKKIGQTGYISAADLNNDGEINIVDLSLVGGNFGQTC